jgi:hypothetical protein
VTTLNRKQVLRGIGAAGLVSMASFRAMAASSPSLTQVNKSWVINEEDALSWHEVKDQNGPALTGNASWRNFLQFLETKLKEYGCVDVHRSPWTFDRIETSNWPDDSKWSLVSGGRRMTVANYGANCGLTGPEGVTAELVLWDPNNKPDVTGKIVIYRPVPREEVRTVFVDADYEYMTPFDSWPVEGKPVPQGLSDSNGIAGVVWDDMTATSTIIQELAPSKPAGLVFAMNLNRAATEGLYTFGVPEQYGFPSVYLDRTNGDAVIADAKQRAKATIRVEGKHIQSEAYELIAFLPGRDYGTDKDEQIQLRTHTDGPSISQDDGAFGLLGVVKYMSNIPQKDRPRSLLIELDCRHFMPGAERAWEAQDYFVKFPHARDKVVGMIAMEHLGQIDYVFDGEDIRPSGRSLQTWIYSSPDQKMIDFADKAAKDNHIASAIVRSPGRPGVHGKTQGPWYGMGGGSRFLGLPAFSMQGDLGAYWAFSGRINRFDARSFCREVSLFCQLTGYLMEVDVRTLHVPKVERGVPGQGLPR